MERDFRRKEAGERKISEVEVSWSENWKNGIIWAGIKMKDLCGHISTFTWCYIYMWDEPGERGCSLLLSLVSLYFMCWLEFDDIGTVISSIMHFLHVVLQLKPVSGLYRAAEIWQVFPNAEFPWTHWFSVFWQTTHLWENHTLGKLYTLVQHL